MIQQIIIKSRKEVETIIDIKNSNIHQNWALISIWGTFSLLSWQNRETLKNMNCTETLDLNFADITKSELRQDDDLILFDETHAKQIVDFIDKINEQDIPVLMVHCAAGISRSGAVGLFVCRYLGLSEKVYRAQNPRILPNFYVLEILNKVSNINADYVQLWKTEENIKKRSLMINFV